MIIWGNLLEVGEVECFCQFDGLLSFLVLVQGKHQELDHLGTQKWPFVQSEVCKKVSFVFLLVMINLKGGEAKPGDRDGEERGERTRRRRK